MASLGFSSGMTTAPTTPKRRPYEAGKLGAAIAAEQPGARAGFGSVAGGMARSMANPIMTNQPTVGGMGTPYNRGGFEAPGYRTPEQDEALRRRSAVNTGPALADVARNPAYSQPVPQQPAPMRRRPLTVGAVR